MITKLKEYRLQKNLTQVEIAEIVGVTSRTIISLENGKYKPSIMLAYKLSLLFNTSIEDLFCLKENKQEEDKKNENI